MNKFPLKEDLHAFCQSIGIKDIPVDSVCPPDYRFMYHWNMSKQPTDDIIMRRVYSTALSKDNDVFSFIEELYRQGQHSFDYKYFSSDDAIDGYLGLLGFNPLYDYCKSRGIGHARSYLSSEAGIIIQEGEVDERWESLKIEYRDFIKLPDDELWTLFLEIISQGQKLEDNYSVDLLREIDALRLEIPRERFASGTHIVTYDAFDFGVRDEIIRELRKYLIYHSNQERSPVRLTIVVNDAEAYSGKSAVEFVDPSASLNDIALEVRFGEYCYDLLLNRLDQFNDAYKQLLDIVYAKRDKLAAYILADEDFIKYTDSIGSASRQEYINNLLSTEEFNEYEKCFQLTDLNDRIERTKFVNDLSSQVRLSSSRKMSSTTGRSKEVVRINEIIDRLLKDVETSSAINKSLYDAATVREISEWEKIEKRVHALGKTDPKKSNKLAGELLDWGYYTMNLFRLMAMNYRSQDQLKDELQFLLRVKKDYNFSDFDPRLRQTVRLLEKNNITI